jgi:hypothetical protein
VTPATTTSYSVTGTTLGCTGTATTTVTVNPNPVVIASATQNTICFGDSTSLTASGAGTYLWSTGGNTPTITVSPAMTTTYSVIGTSLGCTGTSSVTITVNPNPTPSIFVSANPICAGESSTLIVTGATDFTWSGGLGTDDTIVVTPATTTSYSVTGTTLGCTGTATTTVTVNPNPVVIASAFPSAICEGSQAQISAGGATAYLWEPGGMTTATVNVNPNMTTVYSVTGMNNYGCTGSTTVEVQVDFPGFLTTGDNQTICEGSDGVFISAFGATSYLWSPAGTLSSTTSSSPWAFPVTTTFYTVVGTKGQCSDTLAVLVEVLPNPTIDSIAYDPGNQTLKIFGNFQGSVAFIRINNGGMILPLSGGESSALFTQVLLSSGDEIYVETTFGCSVISSFNTSSIDEDSPKQLEVEVYPNPFSEKFFVELPNGEYEVSLANVSGQIVREISVNGNFEILGEDIPSGIYLLKISSDDGNYLVRIVKN